MERAADEPRAARWMRSPSPRTSFRCAGRVRPGDVAQQLFVIRRDVLERGDPGQLQQLAPALCPAGADHAVVEAAQRRLVEGALLISYNSWREGLRLTQNPQPIAAGRLVLLILIQSI